MNTIYLGYIVKKSSAKLAIGSQAYQLANRK